MGLEILVADDESLIRLGLRTMLEEAGHQVTLAADGREALHLARGRHFDVAILDIRMPRTDGLETARVLGRVSPLPILFLTAYSDTDLVDEATDLSVHGYLVKPVQPAQLLAAISVARKRFSDAQAASNQADELERVIALRKVIARAKGRLMEGGLSEEEAYQLLQQRARRTRRSLADIAGDVLAE